MQAIHLRRQLGLDAQTLLAQFPYMVFERDLIDFETADRLAQANGIPMDAPERLDAGLLYTLKLAESSGHSVHAQGTLCAEGGQSAPNADGDLEGCCPTGI